MLLINLLETANTMHQKLCIIYNAVIDNICKNNIYIHKDYICIYNINNMSRVYVGDLIVNKEYRIIDNWNLNNVKRKYPLQFHGIFVKSYSFNQFDLVSTKVEFIDNTDGLVRIISSINEFYEK